MKIWMQSLVALVSGFIFAIGLGVSGMTNPVKVFSFMDVLGHWDPTLMFVMIGAIGIHLVAYQLIKKQKSPLLALDWKIPNSNEITPALIIGAVLFGIGWALAGYCPGPALVTLMTFEYRPILFVLSMLVGMFLFKAITSGKSSSQIAVYKKLGIPTQE